MLRGLDLRNKVEVLIVTQIINININTQSKLAYKARVIVYFTHEWFFNLMEILGGEEYLEKEKIFALCFDNTHPDKLEEMDDYHEVTKRFPNSRRIPDKSVYIGNLDGKPMEIVRQMLDRIFEYGYNIEYLECPREQR